MDLAVLGCGRMGEHHAETIARRLPGVRLAGVVDPSPETARRVAERLGTRAYADAAEIPHLDAVVIATPSASHADLVVAAARAGRHVFCEKPVGRTPAEAARATAAAAEHGVLLQAGFQRRFAPDWRAARARLESGELGQPRLLRSLTRDPGGFDPATLPPDSLFVETLIHDFDVLRYLNPGAAAVEVTTTADALVEPGWRERGLLDTGVVVVRFDNGAIGIAESCFETSYGYDVRAEVLAPGGIALAGVDPRETVGSDVELFGPAYTAELAAFAGAVRSGGPVEVTGEDARAALEIAHAAARSARTGAPVRLSPAGD
jgi:myo-inositol 2-dehydrogenase / D-chiro-inositol 1-dehydrogenase